MDGFKCDEFQFSTLIFIAYLSLKKKILFFKLLQSFFFFHFDTINIIDL